MRAFFCRVPCSTAYEHRRTRVALPAERAAWKSSRCAFTIRACSLMPCSLPPSLCHRCGFSWWVDFLARCKVADEGGVLAFLNNAGKTRAVGIINRAVAAVISACIDRRFRRDGCSIIGNCPLLVVNVLSGDRKSTRLLMTFAYLTINQQVNCSHGHLLCLRSAGTHVQSVCSDAIR